MRVLAVTLGSAVATLLVVGGSLLLVVEAPGSSTAGFVLGTVALAVFVYAAAVLGALAAAASPRHPDARRRPFRRATGVVLAVDVLATVAEVVAAILTRSPAWLPALLIVVGGILAPLAVRVGRSLRRHEPEPLPFDEAQAHVSRSAIRRKVAIVAIVFLAVLVLGAVGSAALSGVGPHRPHVGPLLLDIGDLAFASAAIACLFVSLPLLRALRECAGGDVGRGRRVAKVVQRRRMIALDDADRIAALRYARLAPTALAFQLGFSSLLFAALGLQQLSSLLEGGDAILARVFLVLLGAVLLGVCPLYVVRIRRARRYADDNDAVLA